MPTLPPQGEYGNTPLPTGAKSTRPAPVGGPATTTLPEEWNSPIRIMRAVLDKLESEGPEAARQLLAFINAAKRP